MKPEPPNKTWSPEESHHDVEISFLEADDSHVLVGLVNEVYEDSYDAEWVYQEDEIARRISSGQMKSTIGRLPDGTAIGHVALMVEHGVVSVMHAGVAVVTEAARGHHLFTRLKQFAATWAASAGYFGIFSEATAAHPYSQRANVHLGAVETGFLLGWIPDSVTNNAALDHRPHRESVALFYLKTNDGQPRPIYAPQRHRNAIESIVTASGIHGEVTIAPPRTSVAEKTHIVVHEKVDHNLATISVLEPGWDLLEVLDRTRTHLVEVVGRDAVYVDFSLEDPRTEIVLDACDDQLSFGFAGIFPNQHVGGDLMRLQSLHNIEIRSDDIATASDSGRKLLEYVIEDLERTHANH